MDFQNNDGDLNKLFKPKCLFIQFLKNLNFCQLKLYLCIPTEESGFFSIATTISPAIMVSKDHNFYLQYFRLFKALCLKTPPYVQY